MKKIKTQNLTDLALKIWVESIDANHHEQNARRTVNRVLKNYNNTDYEVLEKIKKHKYPKRLY